MTFSGFGRGKGGDMDGATPAPTSGNSSNLSAFIDQGSQFEGKLSFKDTVRIDGTFRGEITSENTLIVGESGEVQASVESNSVVVSGTVIGDIKARRQVVLHKTAKLAGDVTTPSLIVEEGAVFNGQIKMTSGDTKQKSDTQLKAIKGGNPAADGGGGSTPGGKGGGGGGR